MLLSAVSVLVVAKSSSEIPEGLMNNPVCTVQMGGPCSSVGIIATDYGLDGPGIESRLGEIFRPSRPALQPTRPPVQWVRVLSRG